MHTKTNSIYILRAYYVHKMYVHSTCIRTVRCYFNNFIWVSSFASIRLVIRWVVHSNAKLGAYSFVDGHKLDYLTKNLLTFKWSTINHIILGLSIPIVFLFHVPILWSECPFGNTVKLWNNFYDQVCFSTKHKLKQVTLTLSWEKSHLTASEVIKYFNYFINLTF